MTQVSRSSDLLVAANPRPEQPDPRDASVSRSEGRRWNPLQAEDGVPFREAFRQQTP